jgi:cysteinyl-tRNA synthetase
MLRSIAFVRFVHVVPASAGRPAQWVRACRLARRAASWRREIHTDAARPKTYDGYLQAILDAGFDGVYLDWIEAYSDEDVLALAENQDLDPVEEMIWRVGDVASFGRAQDPDFIVIGQNAAELAAQDDYGEIVGAIAQEQVWFDGGADNDPPGDCPLPRLEADVDTAAYRDSLSSACRRQYDEYLDSTLHVSSEWYLRDLRLAQSKGLVIFTVDYALDADNIAWVYETSRGLGFTPFVGIRALDRFVTPVP